MERDLLSLLVFCRVILGFSWVYSCLSSLSRVSLCVIVSCYMFVCVNCFGLVVSTCQVIGYRKTPLMTPSWCDEIISTKPRWKSVWFVYIAMCFPPALHNIYFIRVWYNIANMCWKWAHDKMWGGSKQWQFADL